ncbi:hypothetical protein RDWZM_000268 [Blomia tropicalis]|uniref:PUL domain-containing protein n=1 Tax=Blomia tropicalis TaxID=40697 RepID=A0A9Q0RMU0_BLOTA|nr:hypothetical protein RDWZM_000268 [Blomia tropicalis]
MATSEFKQYQLSKLIKAHSNAIRDMFQYSDISGSPKLVTVSRDCDAKIFSIINGTINDYPDLVFSDSVAMSSVTVMPRTGQVPMLFFGCANGAIFVHFDGETTPLNVLTFHSQNVCTIRTDPNTKLLASGSWDTTAIVYDVESDKVRFRIMAHSQAIQDVAFLNPSIANRRLCLLTISSDKSCILWDISSNDPSSFGLSPVQLRTYLGHEDCVRGCLIEPARDCFYTVSNDTTIKCWNITTTEEMSTMIGHTHFIYRIAPLGNNMFMTCGEDTTIRLWSMIEQRELQSITLPVISIWCLIAINDTTFIASGSDGMLYVLSSDPSKKLSSEQMSVVNQLRAKQNMIEYAEVVHLPLYEQVSLEQLPASSLGRNYYDEVVPMTLHGLKFRIPFNRPNDPWDVALDFIHLYNLELTDQASIVRAIVSHSKYNRKNNGNDAFSDSSEFPITNMVLFVSPPNWEKFILKFVEFNQQQTSNELKIDDQTFAKISTEFNNPGSNAELLVECYRKLFNWPNNCRFVVYDLLRMNLGNQYFSSYFLHNYINSNKSTFYSIVLATKDANMAQQLTSIRCLTNMFSTTHGSEYMFKEFDFIHQSIVQWKQLVNNRNVHLAYATLWFNFSVMLIDFRKNQNIGFLNSLMSIIAASDQQSSYTDTIGTILNTFGNLLVGGGKSWSELDLVRNFTVIVRNYPKTYADCYEIKRAVININKLS